MRDVLTGKEWDVKAKVVVNATGEVEEGREGGRGERERVREVGRKRRG